ncbi:hypothetical protein NDU88_005173 [Pleurodeles waltl]|uniref:Uncharacterized protein n=1 Tax=Pleurodeles waltl TaxID=8319 RepID=A0AAV7L3N6_PLEWA|nr:hypothetical protein NDU88_005173 [Pleurodeles waltl]
MAVRNHWWARMAEPPAHQCSRILGRHLRRKLSPLLPACTCARSPSSGDAPSSATLALRAFLAPFRSIHQFSRNALGGDSWRVRLSGLTSTVRFVVVCASWSHCRHTGAYEETEDRVEEGKCVILGTCIFYSAYGGGASRAVDMGMYLSYPRPSWDLGCWVPKLGLVDYVGVLFSLETLLQALLHVFVGLVFTPVAVACVFSSSWAFVLLVRFRSVLLFLLLLRAPLLFWVLSEDVLTQV